MVIAFLAGAALALSPTLLNEIPTAFHGVWSFDEEACRNPIEVKMEIQAGVYTREEITAMVDSVTLLDEDPLRIRIAFSAGAEGWEWTNSEEWTLGPSGNRFIHRDERDPDNFEFELVRCE